MSVCQIEERLAGRSYPRTCPTCRLGPCAKGMEQEQLIAQNEALQAQLAEANRALAEWAEVSQRNFQRAKEAEERLAEARAGLDMLRGVGWQPIDTLPPRFTTVDIWLSGGFRVANATHPSQYPTATHWWDFGLGQTSPEPPPDTTLAKIDPKP
jgi:hypothetical protein